MRGIGILFIGICLLSGCKEKELPGKYLSDIRVIRQANPEKASIAPQPAPEKKTQAPEAKPVIAQNKFHIIIASFKPADKSKAEKTVAQWKAKQQPASLLSSPERFRLSIKSFPTEEAANAALPEYRTITGREDIWVYKVP